MIKKFVSLIALAIFLLSVSAIQAQEAQVTQSQAPKVFIKELNLNKTVLDITKGEKTISGSFVVWNSENYYVGDLNIQVELHQGSEFMNLKLIDVQADPTVISLGPNEEKTKTFSYQLSPNLASNQYTLRIQVVTQKGRFSGFLDKILEITANNRFLEISPEGAAVILKNKDFMPGLGVNFDFEETPQIKFNLINSTNETITATPKITIHKRKLNMEKAQEFSKEVVTLKPGEEKTIIYEMPRFDKPESYLAAVRFYENNELISNMGLFRWVVKGQGAEILGLNLNQDVYQKGEAAEVSVNYIGSADFLSPVFEADLGVKIFNKDNELCGQPLEKKISLGGTENLMTAKVDILKDCFNPRVEAEISKDGKLLDKYETKIESISDKAKGILKASQRKILIFALLIIILIGLIFAISKYFKKAPKTLIFLIFFLAGLGFLLGVSEIKASSGTGQASGCGNNKGTPWYSSAYCQAPGGGAGAWTFDSCSWTSTCAGTWINPTGGVVQCCSSCPATADIKCPDGWSDTGTRKWVNSGSCSADGKVIENEQKVEVYKNYNCSGTSCVWFSTPFDETRLVLTGATRNTSCPAGQACYSRGVCETKPTLSISNIYVDKTGGQIPLTVSSGNPAGLTTKNATYSIDCGNGSSGGTGNTGDWGASGTIPKFSCVYDKVGKYTITVTVSKENYNSGTWTQQINAYATAGPGGISLGISPGHPGLIPTSRFNVGAEYLYEDEPIKALGNVEIIQCSNMAASLSGSLSIGGQRVGSVSYNVPLQSVGAGTPWANKQSIPYEITGCAPKNINGSTNFTIEFTGSVTVPASSFSSTDEGKEWCTNNGGTWQSTPFGTSCTIANLQTSYGGVITVAGSPPPGGSTCSGGFTLTVKVNGSGTVTSNPAGINCGSACSKSYNSGASVALTASASAGSYFSGWSGDCSGTGACNLTMNSNKNVTANFSSGPPPPPPPPGVDLWVSLSAYPSLGTPPLPSNLTAFVSGSAQGTINYTFWWNCNSASTNVSAVKNACGDPDGTSGNANGIKFDGISNISKSVSHIYSSIDTYIAKVIVERGSFTAESRASVNVRETTDGDGDGDGNGDGGDGNGGGGNGGGGGGGNGGGNGTTTEVSPTWFEVSPKD